MGTWGQLIQELQRIEARLEPPERRAPGAPSGYDILRRKYLKALSEHTDRAVISYSTAWMEPTGSDIPGGALSINLGDLQGFMEACSSAKERHLDLLLHSPGGDPDAAEAIMGYLRTQFDSVRAIVPVAAMSAATMMSLACDEIVMGNQSQLGPIDPQFTIFTPEGPRSSPGQAILDQFDRAREECKDPANLGVWLPILRSYLPGLLAQCHNKRELAKQFVHDALIHHMFKGDEAADEKATKVSEWFSDYAAFKSHGRRVSRTDAEAQGLNVTTLEDDQILQDLALSVHHANRLTFGQAGAIKMIENHHGRAYIESRQQAQIQFIPSPGQIPGQAPPQVPGPPTNPPGNIFMKPQTPAGLGRQGPPSKAGQRSKNKKKR